MARLKIAMDQRLHPRPQGGQSLHRQSGANMSRFWIAGARPSRLARDYSLPRRDFVRTQPGAVWPGLKPEIAQQGMFIGAASERPMIFALGFPDRRVVDARDA